MKSNSLSLLVGIAICSASCTTSQYKDAPGWTGMASGLRTAYVNDRNLCENKECAKLRARNGDLLLVKLDGESLVIETHSVLGGWEKTEGPQRMSSYTLHLLPGKHTLTLDLSRRGASSKYLRQVEFVAEKGSIYYLYANEVEADGKHIWNPAVKDSVTENLTP